MTSPRAVIRIIRRDFKVFVGYVYMFLTFLWSGVVCGKQDLPYGHRMDLYKTLKKSTNMEEFSALDDEQLVHEISNHPELYDPKNKLYKFHTPKENIWENIGQSLNKSVTACKKRWKNIKDNYYKQKKKKPTGTAATGQRRKNPILDQLAFLDLVKYERRVLTNTETSIQNTEKNSNQELSDVSADESSGEENISYTKTQSETEMVTAINDKRASSNSNEGARPQKRKKNFSSEILSAIHKNQSEREAIMSHISAPTPPPEDEIDLLFQSLAMTVKSFPPLLRAETKKKIFQVIADAEIQLLQPLSTPSSRLSIYTEPTVSTPLPSPNWDQQSQSYNSRGSSNAAQLYETFAINM